MSLYRSELTGRWGTSPVSWQVRYDHAWWLFIITEKCWLSRVIYVLFMLSNGHTQLRACIYVCYVLPAQPMARVCVCVCVAVTAIALAAAHKT